MTTKEAVSKLTTELKNDKSFWESYKANIAMAFQDEFNNSEVSEAIESWRIHEIANKAADRFLCQWCECY
jgi:hypothetical protein